MGNDKVNNISIYKSQPVLNSNSYVAGDFIVSKNIDSFKANTVQYKASLVCLNDDKSSYSFKFLGADKSFENIKSRVEQFAVLDKVRFDLKAFLNNSYGISKPVSNMSGYSQEL